MKKYITLVSFTLFLGLLFVSTQAVFAQAKQFTTEELKQFDGKSGHKAYYAYEGKVYDVTGSRLWKEGEHYGLQAGEDLTGKMTSAPHGTEVFAGFEVMGTYGAMPTTSAVQTPVVTQSPLGVPSTTPQRAWFESPIRLLNISILGWTGIVLGIFFVLTFATCFAMPWAKLPLPWVGSRPGPDPLDASFRHMTWTYIHKYFVWITVILGIVHGILGFMQILGIYL
ncbi:MAG: cytochrome b5 domain-containing protein [Patescibacteria group bacterium]